MIRKLALLGMTGALVLAISGCDDDDSIVPTITISGTAATGAPIVGGTVRAKGANGVQSTMDLTDDDGNYSITAVGMNPPIVVRIEGGFIDNDPLAPAEDQIAMLTTFTTSNVNLTPLTTLAVQEAMDLSGLGAIYTGWNSYRPTAASLADAMALIRANLDPVASALVAGWATYDFITTPFTANHLAFDQVLDTVTCGASGSSTTFAVSCTSGGITWDPAIDTTGFELAEPGTGTGGATVAATVNAGLVGSRELTFTPNGVAAAALSFVGGTTYTFDIAANGTLTVEGTAYTGPFHRVSGNAPVATEINWALAPGIDFAVSNNSTGAFNEVNVYNFSSGTLVYLGQFAPAAAGGDHTPVSGGGTGTITVTNANPTTGNGAKALTGATVTVDGVLTRVQMEGTDFMVKVYYTTATGTVTNVSYLWGNVDFTTGLADNIAFCAGTCGATVDTIANTVVFAGTSLTSDTDAATLNGTVSGLAL